MMDAERLMRLLARLLPADTRDEVAGDLVEQFIQERRSMPWLFAQGVGVAWGLRRGTSRHLHGVSRPSGGKMNGLLHDVRIGMRVLMAHRQVSLLAILMLALGIGGTTAIFSVVNAVLLRPLPYAEPDRLVAVTSFYRGPTGERAVPRVALSDVAEWRARSQSFTSIGAFAYTQLPVRAGIQSFSPVTALVDPEFLPTLGKPLAMGSFFETARDRRHERSAIVSYAFWREAFGGESGAIGQPIEVDGEPYVLGGVLAPDFHFPRADASYFTKPIALVIPASTFPNFPAGSRQWFGIARLRPDTSLLQAEIELKSIAESLAPPKAAGTWSVRLAMLSAETTKRSREALIAILGISIVLLIIASTNLMNLLFSRAVSRLGEMSIRRAIGCTTARLMRQLLIEVVLLAAAGGAAGLLLASFAVQSLTALSPVHLPVTGGIDIDWRVLGFSAAVCMTAALFAGFFPALHVSRRSIGAATISGERTSHSRGIARVQQGLCVAQVALGVALLASAGLLARSFWQLNRVDPGFDGSHVVGFNVSVPTSVPRPERAQFYANALAEIRSIPGVERAGLISFLPPEMRGGVFMGFAIDGVPPADPGAPPRVVNTLISSPDYFATMRMRMVKGRDLSTHDTRDSAPVIIVNEALVRRYFAGSEALGKRVGTGFDGMKPVREIVGIVRDSRDRGAAADPIPTVYIPFEQFSLPYGSIAVRAAVAPESLIPVIRDRVQRLNSAVPVTDFQTIEARIAQSLREPRFYMLMAAVCATLAVLFVTFGLYGLVSYSVSRRGREIGIRMALGAGRNAILYLILRQGLILSIGGIALGLALAAASTRMLESLLFHVEPLDPLTLLAASALVGFVTLTASLIPARRASAINPVQALKGG